MELTHCAIDRFVISVSTGCSVAYGGVVQIRVEPHIV